MRRTKEWWAKYSGYERWFIWHYERNQNKIYRHSGYLPDDCSECVVCGEPILGSGVCNNCSNVYENLMERK